MAGLIDDATGQVSAPATTAATTTNATAGQATSTDASSQGYTAAQSNAAGYTAAQSQAANAALDTNSIDPSQTVAGQLTGLISANSPLLQQAQANSLAQSNSRGLLNSSMANTGAESAVLSTALPIAQQDATTNFTNATNTVNNTNQNSQYNATNQQQTGLANQSATNTASGANAANQQQTNLANQSATDTANQFGAAAANAASSQNAQQATQTSQFNAGQDTSVSQSNAAAANSASQFNASASNTAALDAMQSSVSTYIDSQDNADKVQLQSMDDANKTQLANIQAQYSEALQSSQSAQAIFSSIVGNISSIMTNKDMDADAKQAAVNQQQTMLQDGMAVAGAVANVDLTGLLNFTPSDSTTPAATTQDTSATTGALNPNNADSSGYGGGP